MALYYIKLEWDINFYLLVCHPFTFDVNMTFLVLGETESNATELFCMTTDFERMRVGKV